MLSASFRDPQGRVVAVDGAVIRAVAPDAAEQLTRFLGSASGERLLRARRIPHTEPIGDAESARLRADPRLGDLAPDLDRAIFLRHEAIPFVSYPYEWPPEMLYAAAELTLDLAEAAADDGYGLKDATPYNVLFRAAEPVFVDLLSFERRDPGDPMWLAAAQFERTFLLPLLVNRQRATPLQHLLTTRRDGLDPEEVYRLCGPLRALAPPALSLVALPTWLSRWRQPGASIYRPRRRANSEQARFILHATLRRLRRLLQRLRPRRRSASLWPRYGQAPPSAVKQAFVERMLAEHRPPRVLDVGCNTGRFSALAASLGAAVVAVDRDAEVAGATWRLARERGLDILPLAIDVTRPSPAVGWRNRECASFLERIGGHFDAVLMLALGHHLLAGEGIPLEEIVAFAADATTDLLLIEYVAPDDPMFRRLSRGRDHLYAGLTAARFEAACRDRFTLLAAQPLESGTRTLYAWRRRGAGDDRA